MKGIGRRGKDRGSKLLYRVRSSSENAATEHVRKHARRSMLNTNPCITTKLLTPQYVNGQQQQGSTRQ